MQYVEAYYFFDCTDDFYLLVLSKDPTKFSIRKANIWIQFHLIKGMDCFIFVEIHQKKMNYLFVLHPFL